MALLIFTALFVVVFIVFVQYLVYLYILDWKKNTLQVGWPWWQ